MSSLSRANFLYASQCLSKSGSLSLSLSFSRKKLEISRDIISARRRENSSYFFRRNEIEREDDGPFSVSMTPSRERFLRARGAKQNGGCTGKLSLARKPPLVVGNFIPCTRSESPRFGQRNETSVANAALMPDGNAIQVGTSAVWIPLTR